MTEIGTALQNYISFIGLGVVVMVIVEIIKKTGKLPDGQAGTVATLINGLLFVVIVVLNLFGVDIEGEQAKAVIVILNKVAELALLILSSVGSFAAMRAANIPGFRPMQGR